MLYNPCNLYFMNIEVQLMHEDYELSNEYLMCTFF